jgi:hypothetical protein
MTMGRCETTFGALAADDGLQPGHRLEWLTNRGHLHLQAIGAPAELVERLREIYLKLGGNETALAYKRQGKDPSPDFIWRKDQLVCQWPSVSPHSRPSFLPTDGHVFSPLVATNLPTIRLSVSRCVRSVV